MSRLTLRLPETLHEQLVQTAKQEGTSLNQLIVYLLTRVSTLHDLERQRAGFESLRHRFPEAEAETALREILAAREPEPAAG